MRRVLVIISASVAACAATLVPVPDAHAFSRKVQLACKGDYKRLCPRYKVGSPSLRACMEAKSGEISSNCISTLIDEGVVGRARASR